MPDEELVEWEKTGDISPFQSEVEKILAKKSSLERSYAEDLRDFIELEIVREDGWIEGMEGEIRFSTDSLVKAIDNNVEDLLDELYWDIEDILPAEPPDYDPRFQSIIGLLENVTENQVNMALSAHADAQDIIDAIADNQNVALNDLIMDIDDSLGEVSDSIETASEDHQTFIGACLDGISDTLESVGDTITGGIEATSEIITPALNAIGDVWEYMLEKLLELLKQLFLLDPAQIKEYMLVFFKAFQSFTQSIG